MSAAFPPGSLARVAVDTLLLREEPGMEAKAVARIPRGDIVYLTGPPFHREADGHIWRLIWYVPGYDEWPALPSERDIARGWVAIGEGTTPFMTREPPDCPAEPETLKVDDLVVMPPFTLVECFGDREITVKGTVVTGFGGVFPGEFEPYWLAGPFGFAGAIATATRSESFFYYMPSGPTDFVDGQRIQITGHFDDPAADACRISVGDPAEVAEPNGLARMACQSHFVATSLRVL